MALNLNLDIFSLRFLLVHVARSHALVIDTRTVFKGGKYLETFANIRTIAMDKTGTLTEGSFRLTGLRIMDGRGGGIRREDGGSGSGGSGGSGGGGNGGTCDEKAEAESLEVVDRTYILTLIASLERLSEHPIAAALCAAAAAEGVDPDKDVRDFAVIAGEGIEGRFRGERVAIGNKRMAQRLGWDSVDNSGTGTRGLGPEGLEQFAAWERDGGTAGFIGRVGGSPLAIFSASDAPRPEAAEAVALLKALGVDVIMCTGDSTACAQSVARQVGVTTVRAELLPGDKVDEVSILKATAVARSTTRTHVLLRSLCGLCRCFYSSCVRREDGSARTSRPTVVGMVGDGVNDAPALAAADVGIAMGATGTVVAMETADVCLMDTDLRKLAKGIRIGRMASRKIKENVAISLVTKLAVIVLTLMGHSILWVAIASDVGAMLIVTLNGMTLLYNGKKTVDGGGAGEKNKAEKTMGIKGSGGTKVSEQYQEGQDDGDRSSSGQHGHSHGGHHACTGHHGGDHARHGHGHGHGDGDGGLEMEQKWEVGEEAFRDTLSVLAEA